VFVIFDYDGVIFNSGPAVHRAVVEFYRFLGLGEPNPEQSRRWLGPPIKGSVLRTLRENNVERHDIDKLSNQCFDRLNAATRDLASAFPGALALIEDLKRAEVPVGIATMKAHTEIDELKDVLPALDLVDVYCAPVDHHGGTSKKQLVADVMAKLTRNDAAYGWMVGDRSSDIEAGLAHGLRTVAVTWGAGTNEELRAAQPHHVVQTMEQLRELLLAS
jgi:phosphoglycolate phosphatase